MNAPPAPPVPLRGLRTELGGLLLANGLILVLALWNRWPASYVLWPFWFQSIAIGVLQAHRMFSLKRFSTEGLKANGKPVPQTEAGKRSTTWFFVAHYGGFHFFYFIFLASAKPVPASDWAWVLFGGAAFLFGALREQPNVLARDALGRPNLGSLMFLPYLRVVPMHLSIFATASEVTGPLTMTFVIALKTASDLGMAWGERAIEARALEKSKRKGKKKDGEKA